MDNQKLVARLNRAIGQVEAIKKQMDKKDPDDCLKVLQQLKASINALKKFGQAYVSENIESCVDANMSQKKIKDNLKSVIDGAFSL